MKQEPELIEIEKILPRSERRLKTNILEDKYLNIPIKLIYAKDIDKYIIRDGHHRYYQVKESGKTHINAIITKIQEKTTFKRGMPLWGH